MGLEFCKGHFDRVEIGAVGRQEEKPRPFLAKALGRLCALVNSQIVENDNVAFGQGRRELGLDIGIEGGAVHGFVDDPGRAQAVAAQCGDEGLRPPMAKGGMRSEAVALSASSTQARHFGGDGCFVDEDKTARLLAHERLTRLSPCSPCFGDVSAFAFRCQQSFFYTRSRIDTETGRVRPGRLSSDGLQTDASPIPAW